MGKQIFKERCKIQFLERIFATLEQFNIYIILWIAFISSMCTRGWPKGLETQDLAPEIFLALKRTILAIHLHS